MIGKHARLLSTSYNQASRTQSAINKHVTKHRSTIVQQRRFISRTSSLHANIPPLMVHFPHLHLPRLSNTIRNRLLGRTLIQPYFDNDFTIRDFVQGSKYAAVQVSQCLSSGDLQPLQEMCTQSCLSEVTQNLSLFSMKERTELDLNEEDIFYSFLYQIGIMMDDEADEAGNFGRQVECTWVGHAFKDYERVVEENNGNPMRIKDELAKHMGPTILNFRFIRNYSKGVEDSWTINALNYYKLYDL